ncbi:MAG: sugar transferase [bacterium]
MLIIKRILDVFFSIFFIVITLPIMAAAALGVKMSSPGPVIYSSERAGKNGKRFILHKFRTMHVEQGGNRSRVTGAADDRIFSFGAFMRSTKIDELPQFFDVLRGHMSIVGPRPEDPEILEKRYKDWHMETLKVKPGLTGPGSLHYYTHMERLLVGDDIESLYAEKLLDVKLALDIVYIRNSTIFYDIRLIFRTVIVVFGKMFGRSRFKLPPEVKEASALNLVENERLFHGCIE